jgi:hypothetical protein
MISRLRIGTVITSMFDLDISVRSLREKFISKIIPTINSTYLLVRLYLVGKIGCKFISL